MSDETPQDDLPTETSSVETGVTEAEDQAADAGENAELNREAVEDSVDSLQRPDRGNFCAHRFPAARCPRNG